MIKVADEKWFSKNSQNLRNQAYARKAEQNTPVTFDGSQVLHLKDFFFKVLSGSAQGILIGVLPSAVMKYLLKYSGLLNTPIGADFNAILTLFQIMIPALIGMAIAMQFGMKALDVGVIALATIAASGSIKWLVNGINPITHAKSAPLFIAGGAGDVINAMLTAGLAVFAIWLVAHFLNGFGSVAIILSPIVIGGGIGLIGKLLAPSVGLVTTLIGETIATFTKLAPLPMAMLIAAAFAVIIITPISTVGVALAISLAGLGAGAAAMGIVATTIILIINSWQVNKPGVTVAIFLGAMKGMMPAVFKKPVLILAFIVAGALSAISVVLFNIQGTPTTAGFGWIGMVAPIQSMVIDSADIGFMQHTIHPIIALISWFILPSIIAFTVNWLFVYVLKLYSAQDFQQNL